MPNMENMATVNPEAWSDAPEQADFLNPSISASCADTSHHDNSPVKRHLIAEK